MLQLAEALRVLRITTRKIRTVLWYWLYWSTNATSNRVPLIARHQDEQTTVDHHPYYSSIIDDAYKQVGSPVTVEQRRRSSVLLQNDGQSSLNLFYPSTLHGHDDPSSSLSYSMEGNPLLTEFDEQGKVLVKKKPISSNENNKENECNE